MTTEKTGENMKMEHSAVVSQSYPRAIAQDHSANTDFSQLW